MLQLEEILDSEDDGKIIETYTTMALFLQLNS